MTERKPGKKLTRRERERETRRAEIIAAARKVFAAKGYDAATLDEIAAEAEFAKGTLYGYFDGKRDLFLKMVEEGFDEVADVFGEALASADDFDGGIRALIAAELDYINEHRDFFDIMMSYRTADPEHVRRLRELMIQKLIELGDVVGGYIQQAIDAGEVKDYGARFLAVRLITMAHDFAISVLGGYVDYTLEEGTDIVIDLFFNGVRVGKK
ncbi:MAG: TetR/AcrR family transcriptional regulator [Candidatus Coatesbacteria bacterium]|nr:MAG: TetR/AcrR family transcriptional regulator [Candidatus Coatesbacteria bacterium]